jgi:hypothetical protein
MPGTLAVALGVPVAAAVGVPVAAAVGVPLGVGVSSSSPVQPLSRGITTIHASNKAASQNLPLHGKSAAQPAFILIPPLPSKEMESLGRRGVTVGVPLSGTYISHGWRQAKPAGAAVPIGVRLSKNSWWTAEGLPGKHRCAMGKAWANAWLDLLLLAIL